MNKHLTPVEQGYTLGRVAAILEPLYGVLATEDPAKVVFENFLSQIVFDLAVVKKENPTQTQEVENAYQRGALGLRITNERKTAR